MWAPSTAFVFSDRRQPQRGAKRVGYLDLVFGGDEVAVHIVEPAEPSRPARALRPSIGTRTAGV